MINGTASEGAAITSGGVPRGCVLRPVHFIIYINDIDVQLNSLIENLADDKKTSKSVPL